MTRGHRGPDSVTSSDETTEPTPQSESPSSTSTAPTALANSASLPRRRSPGHRKTENQCEAFVCHKHCCNPQTQRTPRWNIKNNRVHPCSIPSTAGTLKAVFAFCEGSHLFLDNGSHTSDRITLLLVGGRWPLAPAESGNHNAISLINHGWCRRASLWCGGGKSGQTRGGEH